MVVGQVGFADSRTGLAPRVGSAPAAGLADGQDGQAGPAEGPATVRSAGRGRDTLHNGGEGGNGHVERRGRRW